MIMSQVAGVVVSHIVRPAHEDAFENWAQRMASAASAAPGFRSVFRFNQHPAISHTHLQFETRADLDRWLESAEFRALRAEGVGHSLRTIQAHIGSQSTFTIPGPASVPKWKQAAATWVGVYPTLVAVQEILVRPLAGSVNWLILLTCSSIVLTAVLTWFILPRVHRALRPWMFAQSHRDTDV